MKNYDYLLQPLRLSYRQGNLTGMRIGLNNLLKKASEPTSSAGFRTEVFFEAVKTYRVLGELRQAENYCELAMDNILPSANSMQMLAALKRLRVLLYLDTGAIENAKTKLDEIDGYEMTLQEGNSYISRNESDITVETWVLSVEVALADENLDQAQSCFTRAVETLANQETGLRKKRLSPLEMRKHEQYFSDVRTLCDVYGAILRVIFDDTSGYGVLNDLKDRITEQNRLALQSTKIQPNQPLLAKVRCVLGEWLADEPQPPSGINLPEATRWMKFGVLRASQIQRFDTPAKQVEEAVNAHQPIFETVSSVPFPAPVPSFDVNFDKLLSNRATNALEQIATAFQRLEKVAPYLENLAFEKGVSSMSNGNGSLFGGHLLYFDLDALLYNAKQGNLTGFIKLKWKPEYYESQVILGTLPGEISLGEAFLFVVSGVVTDATIGLAGQSASEAEALRNFKTITQLCFSIGLDVPPDLHGEAIQAANVANRPRFLKLSQDDLLNILTVVENETGAFGNIDSQDDEAAFALVEKTEQTDDISVQNEIPPIQSELNMVNLTELNNAPPRRDNLVVEDDDILDL